MARNKYPEETVRKILEVSRRLFAEKGYDHTTIQDIVYALGMSKGAVYHHFKSKEDILDRVTTQYYDDVNWYADIRNDTSLTGLEKLRMVVWRQITDAKKLELDQITLSLTIDPRMLALMTESSLREAAPFCQSLIEEGVADGSVVTDYPQELSEAVMLLFNIWIGVYTGGGEALLRKISFIKLMTDRLGLPVFDEQLMDAVYQYLQKGTPKSQSQSYPISG